MPVHVPDWRRVRRFSVGQDLGELLWNRDDAEARRCA